MPPNPANQRGRVRRFFSSPTVRITSSTWQATVAADAHRAAALGTSRVGVHAGVSARRKLGGYYNLNLFVAFS